MAYEKRYAYPRLSQYDFFAFRLLGPGLGNLLFPWARAVCFAHDHSARLIWPTWAQIKFGPMLRGEFDNRLYSGLFRRPDHYVGGPLKAWLLASGKMITEGEDGGSAVRGEIHIFTGMHGLFGALAGRQRLVFNELKAMTRSEHLAALDMDFRKSINVHIRLGDFQAPNIEKLKAGDFNLQIPLDWYSDTILKLRAELGGRVQVNLFSDGKDEQLRSILNLPNVRRLTLGSSVGDMIALAQSSVLIASASTFSMWGSFLNSAPTIWFPGQQRQIFNPDIRDLEIERDFGGGLSHTFLANIQV